MRGRHHAEEWLGDRITEQALGFRRHRGDAVARDGQVEVLLRPQPGLAILVGVAQPGRLAAVGARPMHKRARERRNRAGRHNEWNRLGDLVLRQAAIAERLDLVGAPSVGAGQHHGRAVLRREVIDRADDADRKSRPRARNQIEGVVGVQRLRPLARIDADRVTGAEQEVRLQERAQDRQQARIGHDLLVDLAPRDEGVDALGRSTLEVVSAAVVAEQRLDPGAERGDLIRVHQTLDDRVAVFAHAAHMAARIERRLYRCDRAIRHASPPSPKRHCTIRAGPPEVQAAAGAVAPMASRCRWRRRPMKRITPYWTRKSPALEAIAYTDMNAAQATTSRRSSTAARFRAAETNISPAQMKPNA